MNEHLDPSISDSGKRLLDAIGSSSDVTFIRLHGNLGDQLIYAGTRQLLSGLSYHEESVRELDSLNGDLAILAGSGGWCHAYHSVPDYLRKTEERFEHVIILPSSFDLTVPCVKRTLESTKALVFAREQQSYESIRSVCRAELAHDCAFFFDYRPYQCQGKGVLNAFRTDHESTGHVVPPDNNDISRSCHSLDQWLWRIARTAKVRTDRAHITIAAALLGKQVEYLPSSYHKLPGIVNFALGDFAVTPLHDAIKMNSECASRSKLDGGVPNQTTTTDGMWNDLVTQVALEIAPYVPAGHSYILVDDNKIGDLLLPGRPCIPFLERGGQYWGAPQDDETAIRELARLLEAKPQLLVFVAASFWWLDYYRGLRNHLTQNFRRIVDNERIIAYDLLQEPKDRT